MDATTSSDTQVPPIPGGAPGTPGSGARAGAGAGPDARAGAGAAEAALAGAGAGETRLAGAGAAETPLAGAAAAAATLRLRAPRHRVSRRAIGYWTLRAALGWLVPLAIEIVWTLADATRLGTHLVWLAVTLVLALLHIVVMPQWRYRVHRWETTAQAVYTQAGWLSQSRRIAPVSRIQTVDTERGPIEQLFGLSNITVTTASAAGPLKIEGLDHVTAQRLVDELTTTTQANPGDAT